MMQGAKGTGRKAVTQLKVKYNVILPLPCTEKETKIIKQQPAVLRTLTFPTDATLTRTPRSSLLLI